MSEFELATNLLGFLLTAYGTIYTFRAMRADHASFSSEPLVKTPSRIVAITTRWTRRVLGRNPPARTVQVGTAESLSTAGSAHLVKTGPKIPDRLELDEKVALLIRRVNQIEEQAGRDRDYAKEQQKRQQVEEGAYRSQLTTELSRVGGQLRDVAIGTLPRQVRGLLLVATGTVLTAAADVVPSAAELLSRP